MNLIGNMVHTLMRHPDQLARLRADRSLVPSAVDEVLRFEPPVQIDGRYVRAEIEIGGHALPKGHGVLTLLGAANRDPAVVDDPERFDVGRSARCRCCRSDRASTTAWAPPWPVSRARWCFEHFWTGSQRGRHWTTTRPGSGGSRSGAWPAFPVAFS